MFNYLKTRILAILLFSNNVSRFETKNILQLQTKCNIYFFLEVVYFGGGSIPEPEPEEAFVWSRKVLIPMYTDFVQSFCIRKSCSLFVWRNKKTY